MEIKESTASSGLVKSKLPDADYVINPYTGCEFGCSYCYASFMGRFVKEPIENWGNYVYAKMNIAEVVEKELASWSPERRRASILLSSVTDPYQGADHKLQLTRRVLEVLVKAEYPGPVGILTKSPLVIRDVDLLKRLPCAEVGLTITTTDDKVSRFLEVRAPLASTRIDTLRRLNEAGISTYAFVGPLLPHFRYEPQLLDDLFRQIAETGTRSVYVEHMNVSNYIRKRLVPILAEDMLNAAEVYADDERPSHHAALEAQVNELIARYNLTLVLDHVISHNT